MRLIIRTPTQAKEAVKKASAKKSASIETIDEAWARIFAMKNSDADRRKLDEVKVAMESGKIGREPESITKRFSKAEALRLHKVLSEQQKAELLRKMVEEMPSNYRLVLTEQEFENMVEKAAQEELIVFDIESTGTDVWADKIVGHVISTTSDDIHYYVPVGHSDERNQLDFDYVLEGLRPIYEDESIKKIAHNAKYDIQMLERAGVKLGGLHWDSLEAMKLLNENETSYALKPLVSKYLNIDSLGYAELFGKGTGFDEIDLDTAVAYAAKDGDITYKLYVFQRYHLEQHGNLLEYFETVEMPLLPIVSEMEMNGYVIDREFAREYGDQLREEAAASYKKVQEALLPAYKRHVDKNNANPPTYRGGPYAAYDPREREKIGSPVIKDVPKEVNLNSPAQLKAAIEEYIGKPIENTDAKQTLKPLSKKYPVIKELLNYREKTKLLSTYIDALPELIREQSGRLHANFHQNGTKTGRFSSTAPNLQNQPEEARKIFVAPEGYYIVNADFSAQEVRIIASLSKEEVLLRAFAEGKDAYASLASEFFGKPYEECYKNADGSDTEERKKMKVVLLMSMYGASKYGLAQALDITPKEAEKFLADFFKKYRNIDRFIKETQAFANKHGFVWIGDKQRKRRLPEARGNIRQYSPERNRAMRQGPNARVQGEAAIQTKVTMLKLAEVSKERGWKLWSTTHDEVQLLMPTSIGKYDLNLLDEIMTKSYLFDGVENATDIEIQNRWSVSITIDEYLRGVEVPDQSIVRG